MAGFNSLPNEILIKIFSYFTTEELKNGPAEVCQNWREITRLRALTIQNQKDLIYLSEKFTFKDLTSVEITTHIDFINRLLYGLGTLCSNLKDLTIRNCNPLQENHIEYISKKFTHLEHIDVFLASGFTEEYLIHFMKNVKSLVLNNRVLNTHLFKINEECLNIEALNMYGFVEYFPIKELNSFLVHRFTNLKELTLRCSEVTEKNCYLLGLCVELKVLRLYSCWLITPNSLFYLSKLKSISVLHLTGLKLINKVNLSNFLYSCEMDLQELNLSSSVFDEQHCELITRLFPNLAILELWKCKYLSEKGVLHIVENLGDLKILDLNMGLSPDALINICNLSKLEHLRYAINAESKSLALEMSKKLVVTDCSSRYKGKYFRGTNEGYRANLFYYSLRSKMIQPVKCESEINVDDMFADML